MEEIRIVFGQLGAVLLTVVGAVSWTGEKRGWAIALWIAAIVVATSVATIEVRQYWQRSAEEKRAFDARARLTPLIDDALRRGEALEYAVRDDKDTTDAKKMHERHYAAFEEWRSHVYEFLGRELPGTVAAKRFKTADGAYGVGPLGFELARLRRQRDNLALVYDNLDAYIARSTPTNRN